MAKTKIEWSERVWNPITGCTKISAGCKNCYAESIAKRFWNGRKFTDVQFHEERLIIPIKNMKPSTYFVNSMSDLFHEEIYFEEIERIWNIMKMNPRHTFQVLTKRPERAFEFYEYLSLRKSQHINSDNIWLGVSVENTEQLKRLDWLEKIPMKIRLISFEPLLEGIDFYSYCSENSINWDMIKWAIIGCESGQNKRDCELQWVYDLYKDLKYFEIPTFIKQLNINGKVEKNINNFPESLKTREYPKI